MEDLTKVPTFDLANRLNQIRIEKQQLDMEYNKIVYELWDRIPSLKTDENMQPKVIKKGTKKQ